MLVSVVLLPRNDLLTDFLLEPQHDVLHLAFKDVDHCQVTLVGCLLDCRENNRLGEVGILILCSLLKGSVTAIADRLKAVS